MYQPRTLREPEPQQRIAAVGADAMVVAAYGLILPAPVLAAPGLGCINIHASLLPRWRGAAPIQRAIEAGDSRTGITIMQMDEGLDTGPMLLASDIPIGEQESAGSLHDRLAELGARLIVEALDGLARGSLKPIAQPAQGVTYATKISKSETALDWREPAQRLADRIRAFDPFPGAVARLDRSPEPLKVWRARAVAQGPGPTTAPAIAPATASATAPATASATALATASATEPGAASKPPGTVLRADPEGLEVACGQGVLSLLELQKPGGRRLGLAEFLRGFPISAGERFQLP